MNDGDTAPTLHEAASRRGDGANLQPRIKKFKWNILALGAGVFGASFLIRFLNPEFLMEQYIRLVGARQILNGELPDQDFLNRGYTLMYYAAAGAMAVFGDGLLGDLVLTAGLISFGAALTWFLSYRASGSVTVAGVAVLIAVSSYPALYNYPKVFLPVLGLFVIWRYIDHPSVGRLLAVSAAVVLALLFRHDHGLYLGLATVPMLACVHLPGDHKVFLQRALIVLVSVLAFGSPYILFLTANDRLVAHVRTSLWQGGSLVDAVQVTRTPFDIDLSQPLVRWVYDEAQVSVHWAEDVSDPVRQVMEERHQLRNGEFLGDRTWRYAIDGLSEQRLGALVGEPDIEDAQGIHRTVFRMPVVIAAGLRNEANATAWFYYATVSLPPLSLIVLGMKRFGWLSSQSALQCEAPKILTAAVYCLILHQALIRGSLDSRLADVSTPTAVLGAWLLGQALTRGAAPVVRERLHAVLRTGAVKMTWRKATGILLPLLMMLATLVLLGVTVWSAMAFGRIVPRFKTTGILEGPLFAQRKAVAVAGELRHASLDWWAPSGSVGLKGLTRYVRECTTEEDRLMLTWLEPRPYFFSGRLFAGGMFVFHQGWLSFPEDQRLTVDRLRNQSVPIVIADADSFDQFTGQYAIVGQYLAERYVPVAESTFGDEGRTFRVLVDSTRARKRVYEPLSLPCYT